MKKDIKKCLKVIAICLSILLPSEAFAQTGKIVFEKTVHDFGNSVPEKGGNITCRFTFTNKGDAPVTIQDITTSCGCTTPDWTKQPIAPGAQGYVDATYRPLGRIGNFTKSLTVTNNGDPRRISLSIKGVVVQAPLTFEEEYPIVKGFLRLSGDTFEFGRLFPKDKHSTTLKLYNDSTEPVEVSFKNMPKYLKANANFIKLNPKEKGIIIFDFEEKGKHMKYGTNTNKFEMLVNKGMDKILLTSVVTIIPETTWKENTPFPNISWESSAYVFSNVKQGALISYDYKFINTGLVDLKILAVNPPSDRIESSYSKIVKPGERGFIRLNFNTKGLKGVQHFNIEIVTNMPYAPLSNIVLRGNVVE